MSQHNSVAAGSNFHPPLHCCAASPICPCAPARSLAASRRVPAPDVAADGRPRARGRLVHQVQRASRCCWPQRAGGERRRPDSCGYGWQLAWLMRHAPARPLYIRSVLSRRLGVHRGVRLDPPRAGQAGGAARPQGRVYRTVLVWRIGCMDGGRASEQRRRSGVDCGEGNLVGMRP